MNKDTIEEICDQLWEARRTGAGCEPVTSRYPEITIEDAYSVSVATLEKRVSSHGVRLVGKKIGLTAKAVQTQLGVDQPDFGYLTSDMLVQSGGVLPSGSLQRGRVEGEVAFVLAQDLRGPGVTVDDVIAATAYVQTCIEIIDSRILDWKIKIQDTVADNASSAFFVLGERRQSLKEIDLAAAKMELQLNNVTRSTGSGVACMDHPLIAVAWLANMMGSLGDSLKAGEIILSGAYGPVVPISEGDHCRVAIEGLGSADFVYQKGK